MNGGRKEDDFINCADSTNCSESSNSLVTSVDQTEIIEVVNSELPCSALPEFKKRGILLKLTKIFILILRKLCVEACIKS